MREIVSYLRQFIEFAAVNMPVLGVPSDPQRGLYVIDVPRSVRMPHAVVVKGVSLRCLFARSDFQ